MISDENFRSLQSKYLKNETPYSDSNPNYKRSKLFLWGISKLDEINSTMREKYSDKRHWYQQQFIRKGINTALSAHFLTKNHFYDSAYRDVRTLIEIYLLLNYMNENKIEVAIQFKKQEREIENSELEPDSEKWSWEEIRAEDDLHEMISKEKNRFKAKEDDFGRLFDFFSNRNVHPTRVDGIHIDRKYAQEEERQLLDWQLDFVLGLFAQTLKLYSDTPDYGHVKKESLSVVEDIEEYHTVQKFLEIALENFPE